MFLVSNEQLQMAKELSDNGNSCIGSWSCEECPINENREGDTGCGISDLNPYNRSYNAFRWLVNNKEGE